MLELKHKSKHLTTLFVALLWLAMPTITWAQKKKVAHKNTPAPVAKHETPGLQLYRSMIANTAKVMFVDSMVVDKEDFLKQIPLPSYNGKLAVPAGKQHDMVQFTNGWQDMRIITMGDSTHAALYVQYNLANKWSEAQPMQLAVDSACVKQNYPFLCSDGTTLYFSAEGEESMGGRDIFMSGYDADRGEWYKPQNYGLPFNSTANDYLLAISDVDSLGWLVTDRRQPEDKVCIYTFEVTGKRADFSNDDFDEEEIEKYARILCVKDTWQFGNRKAALQRRQRMLTRNFAPSETHKFKFAIDDKRVVTSSTQLHSIEAKKLYEQLVELNIMLQDTQTKLQQNRMHFRQLSDGEQKTRLAKNIQQLESYQEQIVQNQKQIGKQLRQYEVVAHH